MRAWMMVSLVLGLAVFTSGCPRQPGAEPDVGSTDAGTRDGALDAGDAARADGALPDAAQMDASGIDASGELDASDLDAAESDAATEMDAFAIDAFAVDAFAVDAFAVDAFAVDAFAVDAFVAPVDASSGGAILRINEVNANVAMGCDLIELRVVTAGSIAGLRIEERRGGAMELTLTFPAVDVSRGDFIVVHLNAGNAVCNPGGATAETLAVTQQPAATFTGNFDTAYDFWAVDAGLTSTDNVLTVYDASDVIIDALFASNDPAGLTAAAATEAQAAAVGAAGQWSPMLPTYIDVIFRMNAVSDLDATGTTAAGTSIQRIDDADTNATADWTTGAGAAATWGARNAGQTF